MEHRWSERVPVSLEATLARAGSAAAIGRTRDLSAEGAFLEVQTGLMDLRPGTPLMVGLMLPESESPRRVRIPAVVVHRNTQGAGVMFASWDGEPALSIRNVLRGMRAGDRSRESHISAAPSGV
jgi:hypothetical protein